MENIVLYSRVSTQDQNYESQFDALRSWAKRNDFNVVEVFGEKVSGYDLKVERKEYNRMKDFVLNNNIKNIAVWEISRLSRSMAKTNTEIEFYTAQGINVHFIKENLQSISDNVTNTLLLTILAAMAQMERNTIIDRNMRGKLSAAKNGKAVNYGVLPYGYIKDDGGKLIVNEKEAKVVRDIYDYTLKGIGIRKIADTLNSLNIPTRYTINGKKRLIRKNNKTEEVKVLWRNNTISKILHSEIYIGKSTFKDISISIPSIISEDDWNKVQLRFKENIGYSNTTKYNYLFKGKLRCGNCGLIYSVNTRNNIGSYYCSGRKDKGVKCRNGQILSSFLDETIWNSLILYPSFLKASKIDFDNKSQINDINNQIIYFESEIEKLESKRKRTVKAFIDDQLTEDDYNKELLTIRNLSVEYSNKVKVLRNLLKNEDEMDWPNNYVKVLTSKEFEVRREVVENLIDKVLIYQVTDNEIKIDFEKELEVQDKIYVLEIYAYNCLKPMIITLTTRSKNIFYNNIDLNTKEIKKIDFNMFDEW